jgi:magnesium-transporting ATPase (P-type)
MTLTDDNFASIVAAVEEGRGVFANIKKYLMYLLSANLGEIGLLTLTALLGKPLPLSAVQILYVNLATDGLPALALAVDPPERDLMHRPPRSRSASIFTRPVVGLIALGGIWSTAVTVTSTQIGLTITPPTAAPSAGLPASFTFAIGTLPPGDFVRDVAVDWGDGKTQDLGTISASTTVSHVYAIADTYTVKATLHDTAGNSTTVSTSVTVVATSNPTIVITPTVPVGHPVDVTFQIQVTAPSGVGILEATIDFGDGQTQNLGGLSGTVTLKHTYRNAGSYPVTLTVKDTLNRTTTGSTSVTIS